MKNTADSIDEPTVEIPLVAPKNLNEMEERANEMASEIIDVMKLLGRAHKKLQGIQASPETMNKFVQLTRQLYTNIKKDIPSLWRPSLVEQIEEEVADSAS